MKRLLAALVVITISFALSGCADSPARDEAAVEQTVIGYTEALPVGFKTFDMNAIAHVATEEHAADQYIFMAALAEGRVQLLATLRDIQFGEVSFPEEGVASVETTESWDYDHISLDTSKTVRSARDVVYRLRYDLTLFEGRQWLVNEVTSLDDQPISEEETSSASETATP